MLYSQRKRRPPIVFIWILCIHMCSQFSIADYSCSFDSRPVEKLAEMTSFSTIIQKNCCVQLHPISKISTCLSPVDLVLLEEKRQQQTKHMHTCGHSGLISGLLAARRVTVFNICCHVWSNLPRSINQTSTRGHASLFYVYPTAPPTRT